MASFFSNAVLPRAEEAEGCGGEAADTTNRGLRIAAIFIIMATSAFGALTPVFLARQRKMHVPKYTFFICKYTGTGVIIATAWMHLLEPASDQLGDPCLEGRLGDYPWAFGIGLWTVMMMFFVEMLAAKAVDQGEGLDDGMGVNVDPALDVAPKRKKGDIVGNDLPLKDGQTKSDSLINGHNHSHGTDVERRGSHFDDSTINDVSYPPNGDDHLGHRKDHVEGDSQGGNVGGQLLAIFILEFGVLFHSVFIGLTLGTTDELVVLLIVLSFHQLFEGLGLGSRLATAPWPKNKRWLPYLLGCGFALSTPIGIAAGIGAQPKNSDDQKLINGIFDAISAGILMYTGLVELLAHEFMFNPYMRRAPIKIQLFAFGCVLFGVFVMSLLAKWA